MSNLDNAVTPQTLLGKTILLVDDNPTNLGVIADYLEAQGFTILVARDGRSGIEKAHYAQPDLILLDVMMPGIDGFETCRQLKADETTRVIPIIFMTALAETFHKVQGFEAGAVDYVTKPIQQEELLARVLTHLRLRDLSNHLAQLVEARTQELEAAYARLEKLDRAKSDFITVISHELRTPLSIVDGYAQMLQPYTVADEGLGEIAESILRGTKRMVEIINHVLDATKIDQDSLNLAPEKVVLASVVKRVFIVWSDALQSRGLSLHIEGLDDLPPVWGDPDLLERVFRQVVGNAIKYTPDGGEIRITGKTLSSAPPQVEIAICDTGIGIDPEHLELIFEKFYQANDSVDFHSSSSTKFKGGGPGLGLAIAKGIVTAHGGQIWAISEKHDEVALPGSCFYVRLPVGATAVT